MKKICAIFSSYNRCEHTLAFLRSFVACDVPIGYQFKLIQVDDASTDGTADAVKNEFPFVDVLSGNGDLFWAGAMRKGIAHAVQNFDPDGILLLNDDVVLLQDSLTQLFKYFEILPRLFNSESGLLLVGATKSPRDDSCTYGASFESGTWWMTHRGLEPNGYLQPCNLTNGNFLFMSRSLLNSSKVGGLDSGFRHCLADFDLGLRAYKSGALVYLLPYYVGLCERNDSVNDLKSIGFLSRIRKIFSIKMLAPREFWFYCRRHKGRLWVLAFVLPYIRAAFPRGRAGPDIHRF